MTSHVLRLPDIVIDEAGSSEPLEWTGTANSLGSDLDAIRFHADRNLLGLEERSGTVVIRGRHRTGIVLLPTGRRIVLRTKLPGIVLLYWLVYLGEFPDFQHGARLEMWLPTTIGKKSC